MEGKKSLEDKRQERFKKLIEKGNAKWKSLQDLIVVSDSLKKFAQYVVVDKPYSWEVDFETLNFITASVKITGYIEIKVNFRWSKEHEEWSQDKYFSCKCPYCGDAFGRVDIVEVLPFAWKHYTCD